MNTCRSVESAPLRRVGKKLSAYAAGLSALIATELDACAAIVHVNLSNGGVTVDNGAFDIDIDRDQIADFQLAHSVSSSAGHAGCDTSSYGSVFCTTAWRRLNYSAKVLALGGNRLIGRTGDLGRNLPAGALIDDVQALQQGAVLSFYLFSWSTNSSGHGTFRSDSGGEFGRGYLGFSFSTPGSGQHVGWMDLESFGQDGVRLYGFAYETEPGEPILAGDTGGSANDPGDTNGDGQVDIIDLNNVRNNFGATGEGVLGDTNGDDVVSIEDLNAVRNNFGAGNPVPEPPSLVLLAAGAAGLAVLRRKRMTREPHMTAGKRFVPSRFTPKSSL